MKIKHRVQWRLFMVMNCIIFLDRVGLTFILKRDYRRSDSCSKQILSRSYMYSIWIKSPKAYTIYHSQGETINLFPNCAHEMHWSLVRGVETVPSVPQGFFLQSLEESGCHSPAAATPVVTSTPPSRGCHGNQLCLPRLQVAWTLEEVMGDPGGTVCPRFVQLQSLTPRVCSSFLECGCLWQGVCASSGRTSGCRAAPQPWKHRAHF